MNGELISKGASGDITLPEHTGPLSSGLIYY